MTLLNELAEAGATCAKTEIDKRSGKWFDIVTEKAEKVVDGLDGPVKDAAKAALDSLVGHKSDLLHLGGQGLTAFVAFLALGNEKNAKELLYLANEASLDELLAASDAAADKTVQAKKDDAAAQAKIVAILKDVGVSAAKSLLPVMLAVV